MRAVLWAIAVLLLYLACSWLLFRAAWRDPAARSMGFYNDPQQFMWFLGWAAFAVGHHQAPFFSTYLNYPHGVNLLWNTSVLLPGTLLAPVTARWGPVVAYNLLVTLALSLSGWCAYLAFRRFVRSRLAAAVGGLLYGFSPYMTAQAQAHPHLIVALAPPLVLLLLHDMMMGRRRPAWLPGALLGVVLAAQLLTGEELLATTILTAALGLLLLLLAHPAEMMRLAETMAGGQAGIQAVRPGSTGADSSAETPPFKAGSASCRAKRWALARLSWHKSGLKPAAGRDTTYSPDLSPGLPRHVTRLRSAWFARRPPSQVQYFSRLLRGGAAAVAVFLLLGAVPLLAQFAGPQRVGGALHAGRPYVADLLSLVVPGRMQWLSPAAALRVSARFNASLSEQNAYLGLPLLLLLLWIALRRWRHPVVRWAALLAIVMAVLALGGHLEVAGRVTPVPLPWLLVERLPLLGNVITGRLMLYVYLLAGLLLALYLDRPRAEITARKIGVYALAALALLPLLPRPDYPVSAKVVPPFFHSAALARVPAGSVALLAPFAALSRGTYANASSAMLWQSAAGMRFRLPEGYVFVPRNGAGGNAGLTPPPSTTQRVMSAILQGRATPPWNVRLRRQLMGDLRRWRVQTVIVGPMPHQAQMLALFRFALGRGPAYVGGVFLWPHLSETRS